METRMLEVKLNDSELLARGRKLAACLQSVATLKADLAEARRECKEGIEVLEAQIETLQRAIEVKAEVRAVEVEKVLQGPAANPYVEFVRTDTGEIVERRKATAQEVQGKLEFEEEEEAF